MELTNKIGTRQEVLGELLVKLADDFRLLDRVCICTCGLTQNQCHTLLLIAQGRDLSINDIASKMGLDVSTVSRNVDRLVEKGIVSRIENPEDRRAVCLSLTQEGKNYAYVLTNNASSWIERLTEGMTEAEMEEVIESLRGLLERIKKILSTCC